jgi:hypothetical protein
MISSEFAKLIDEAKEPYGPDGWWSGRCPTKSHENPRDDEFGWKDGAVSVLVKCQKGCAREAVLTALGLTKEDLRLRGLTVEQLAESKGFTAEYLRNLGVEQAGDRVRIGYRMIDGSPAPRWQLRSAGKPKFTWNRVTDVTGNTASGKVAGGRAIVPYGLWRLAEMRSSVPAVVVDDPYTYPYLFVVEGASDCWSAWLHGEPALGLPGAATARLLQAEHLEGFAALYLVREPGQGGDMFVRGVTDCLSTIGYTGLVFDAPMPDGLKDVNEVLQRYPAADAFRDQLRRARSLAVPVDVSVAATPATPVRGRRYEQRPGGNRDRLVDAFGQDIAYATGIGWLDWTGTYWRRDV